MNKDPNKPDLSQFKHLNLPKEWVNPPQLSELKKDLKKAQMKHSEHMAKVAEWTKYYKAERLHKDKQANKSCYVDKTCRKLAEWVIPKLTEPFLSNTSLFKLIPTGANDQKSAKINTLIINQQFANQLNSQKFIDELVRSTVINGTGIVFVGWDYQEGERVREEPQQEIVPITDDSSIQQIMQLVQQAQQDPSIIEQLPPDLQQSIALTIQMGQPVLVATTGTKKVKETYARVNQPYLEVCDLEDILFDPDCKGNLNKADFIIRKYTATLSELRNSGNYPILDDPKFDTNLLKDSTSANYYHNDFNKARNRYTIYEYWGYWDYKNEGIVQPIIATWAGDTLLRLEVNPYPDGILPFATCVYTPIIGDIYGEPDTEIVKNNQDLISALMRASIDMIAKSAGGQTAIPKGYLDPVNLRRFLVGDNYEYTNQGLPAQQAIYQHMHPVLSPSMFELIQYTSLEAENLTGVRPFSQSIDGSNPLGNTSLAAKAISDSIVQRSNATLRRVAKCVTTVARFIVMLNQKYLTEDFMVQVSEEESYQVNPNDLMGNFDFTTSVETVESKNNRLAGIMTMLQTVGNQFGEDIIKHLLAELFDIYQEKELASKLRNYTPPEPNETEQAIQQLTIQKEQASLQLIMADVQLRQAQAQEAMAKAQLVPAKLPTEQAKAMGQQARAGLTSLKAQREQLDLERIATGQAHKEKLEEIRVATQANYGNNPQSSWVDELSSLGNILDGIPDDGEGDNIPTINLDNNPVDNLFNPIPIDNTPNPNSFPATNNLNIPSYEDELNTGEVHGL